MARPEGGREEGRQARATEELVVMDMLVEAGVSVRVRVRRRARVVVSRPVDVAWGTV